MKGCIWKVAPEDRLCDYCIYGNCENSIRPKNGAKEACDRYVSVMNDLCGINVLNPTRKREAVWGRNLIALQMTLDGFIHEDIAKCLGKDRCTVTHGISNANNMLDSPRQYPVEYKVWREFKEIIANFGEK